MWTLFFDMSSGGYKKESFSKLIVELPEAKAVEWFEQKYGHNPYDVTCSCCGSDYAVCEYDTVPDDFKGEIVAAPSAGETKKT